MDRHFKNYRMAPSVPQLLTKIDMRPNLRYLLSAASILLLCSCSAMLGAKPGDKPPSNQPAPLNSSLNKAPAPDKVFQAADGSYPAVESIFDEQQEIMPAQSIEKGGVLVSYSLQTVPSKVGDLQRLALIFRNKQGHAITIEPEVFLTNAKGRKIKHYSKRGFLKASSYLAVKSTSSDGKALVKIDKSSINERKDWINTYWLKSSYRIPAQGIAIGELVYYCDHCRLPLKLLVRLGKQEYAFTTGDSLPVAKGN